MRSIRVKYLHQLRWMYSTFYQLIYLFKEHLVVKKPERKRLIKQTWRHLVSGIFTCNSGCFFTHNQPSIDNHQFLFYCLRHKRNGGAMRDRTADLLDANQALSQLSYSPISTCLFCAWTASPHGAYFWCAASLSRSHTNVCSLVRSLRALPITKNPALKSP